MAGDANCTEYLHENLLYMHVAILGKISLHFLHHAYARCNKLDYTNCGHNMSLNKSPTRLIGLKAFFRNTLWLV